MKVGLSREIFAKIKIKITPMNVRNSSSLFPEQKRFMFFRLLSSFQTELWMNEKQKKLEVEANKGDISSLEDKIKKLQKHQAFQAELAANQPRITTIKEKGEGQNEIGLTILCHLWNNALETWEVRIRMK